MESDSISVEHLLYFKELFLKYYEPLCVYALRYMNDADTCRDIVQDCFVDLWEKRSRLDFSSPLKPLLYKSVHDKSVDYNRRAATNNENIDEVICIHPLDIAWNKMISEHIEGEVDCKLVQDEIDMCVKNLPSQCAKIFRMSREQGLSNKEIALNLHISIKAVEKQITKALSAIRSHLINTGYASFIVYLILYFQKHN